MYLVFCVVQHMRGDKASFTKQTRRYRGSVGDTAANLHTLGWGWGRVGGYSWLLKTQSPKSCPNFHLQWGWEKGKGEALPRIGYSWQNEPKILQAQARPCITCVESNQ